MEGLVERLGAVNSPMNRIREAINCLLYDNW